MGDLWDKVSHKSTPVMELTPNPGSLSSTIYVPSLNNILDLAIPLTANEFLQNKTYPLNYTANGLFGIYNIHIDSITFNNINIDKRHLEFVNGTDTLQLRISGIDLDASLIGKATALKLIPASIDAFSITNLTIVLQFNTTSNDGVHFNVGGMSYFHVDNFSLTMGQRIW